jgi:hypothetical protein
MVGDYHKNNVRLLRSPVRNAVVIRTKGRNRFDYNGRPFVWYVESETQLRIASVDKHFVVMLELVGHKPLMSVAGQEFLGIPASVKRPTWLVAPRFNQTVGGALVREILDWCFDPEHEINLYDGPKKTTIQRAWDSLTSN